MIPCVPLQVRRGPRTVQSETKYVELLVVNDYELVRSENSKLFKLFFSVFFFFCMWCVIFVLMFLSVVCTDAKIDLSDEKLC